MERIEPWRRVVYSFCFDELVDCLEDARGSEIEAPHCRRRGFLLLSRTCYDSVLSSMAGVNGLLALREVEGWM
jgi:hypothetical protein